MRTFLPRFLQLVLAGMLLAAGLAPAHATTVLPLYLEQVIDQSTTAFEGTCVENRTERDAATGFVVTYTTFEVKDVLKGDVATRHTIKQIGGKLPGEEGRRNFIGVPTFAVGGNYIVFLAGVSSVGFSSPIGLSQGQFHIRDDNGVRRLGNGRDFRETTSHITAHLPAASRLRVKASAPVSDMDVEEFKQTVRSYLGGAR